MPHAPEIDSKQLAPSSLFAFDSNRLERFSRTRSRNYSRPRYITHSRLAILKANKYTVNVSVNVFSVFIHVAFPTRKTSKQKFKTWISQFNPSNPCVVRQTAVQNFIFCPVFPRFESHWGKKLRGGPERNHAKDCSPELKQFKTTISVRLSDI